MSLTPSSEIDLDDKATEFATEVHSIARNAANEEELRIGMSKVIDDLAGELGLNIDPEHERTLLSSQGRPDSVYGDLVIEYKDPNRQNWQHEALEGRSNSDSGLIDYMYDISKERSHDEEGQKEILDRMLGVGTNGFEIFFCRYQPEKQVEFVSSEQTHLSGLEREEVAEGVEIVETHQIRDGARRFLMYLRSLHRKALTSQKLVESFGKDSDLARETVALLYDELQKGREENERISTLYEEWERVFGIVYGEELDQIREDREEFGVVYGMDEPEVRPLLFSVHTYYALFMKALVRELVASIGDNELREATLYEPNDNELKRKLEDIEDGKGFRLVGLEDFFEEGFFGWYLDAWNADFADQIRDIVTELSDYEAATPTLKPEAVRDILKDLYQELVPQVIRHDLGEFLTPDWLADYTIEAVEYEGEGRVLDPACGSGTFLLGAIQRIRQNSEREGEELLEEILGNVVGFDLNPIAVITSRTNYLLGLGELAFTGPDVRIPVYQSDSILTPSKYIDWFNSGEEAYKIPTIEGEFNVPALESQAEFETLFSLVDDYIRMGASPDEFLKVVQDHLDLSEEYESLVKVLYTDIWDLDKNNQNGVWAQLLRNRTAPEFVGKFDYIIGNPPWVNWGNLSEEYREMTNELWEDYELFDVSGYAAMTTRDDIAILMTYVAIDEYLRADGELGFTITQTLFKSHQAGRGFRRFSIPKQEEDVPLNVKKVDDLSGFNPFDATNQTAVIVIQKGEETKYPVPYRIWRQKEPISKDDRLDEVLANMDILEVVGEPVDKNDPKSEWLTLTPGAISALRNTLGGSDYNSRVGMYTCGADGLFCIEVDEDRGETVVMHNVPTEGKQRTIRNRGEVKREIEKDLIYPAAKGRQITERWKSDIEYHTLVPHKNERGPHSAYSASTMRTDYPKTYQFLQEWEEILRETRARNSKFYNSEQDPFYLVDNMGEYSFASYKMGWRRKSNRIQATVLEPVDIGLGEEKPVMPLDTVVFLPFENADPAHFTCAVMNSIFTQLAIRGYANLSPGLSDAVLDNVNIPNYDDNDEVHKELAELSKAAHEADDEAEIEKIENEINDKARQLWDITKEQLEEVEQSLEGLDL